MARQGNIKGKLAELVVGASVAAVIIGLGLTHYSPRW